MSKNIEEVVITGNAMVHIVIRNESIDKSYYLPVSELNRLIQEYFIRVIELQGNTAYKEHYIQSLGNCEKVWEGELKDMPTDLREMYDNSRMLIPIRRQPSE